MTNPTATTTTSTLPKIKTRLLIISDTHASTPKPKPSFNSGAASSTDDELSSTNKNPRFLQSTPTGFRDPLPEADVVLHCGDLTRRGDPTEFETSFSMLRSLRAPLKLVIAGNHDLALDEDHYCNWRGRDRQDCEKVKQIIKDSEQDGVRYLTEGTYEFNLENGARLRIFASPYTPQFGYWAFQYDYKSHGFDIASDVDVVMTHGPPLGILDIARLHNNAGCPNLFRSVYASKPMVHCFGHIHEAWGAELIHWNRDNDGGSLSTVISPASAIDKPSSRTIFNLQALLPNPLVDDGKLAEEKQKRLLEMSKKRGCHIDLTQGENTIIEGEQTLFVNASIMSMGYRPSQMPWLVDVNLPEARSSGHLMDG